MSRQVVKVYEAWWVGVNAYHTPRLEAWQTGTASPLAQELSPDVTTPRESAAGWSQLSLMRGGHGFVGEQGTSGFHVPVHAACVVNVQQASDAQQAPVSAQGVPEQVLFRPRYRLVQRAGEVSEQPPVVEQHAPVPQGLGVHGTPKPAKASSPLMERHRTAVPGMHEPFGKQHPPVRLQSIGPQTVPSPA